MAQSASIDPNEVAYYERLADTWWDEAGPFWPLHRLNGLRLGFIRDAVCRALHRDPLQARPLAGLGVLDIGCGGGILSEAVARLGADVHGVDVVERNIAVASLHARHSGVPVRYEATSAEALVESGRRYDVVLNMEVVEHVADLPGFLHACSSLMQPRGVTVVSTINRTALSYLCAIVGAEYILRWLPKGTHQWRRFRKPRELEAWLARDGVRVVERCGVAVNPLTKRFRLTPWMSVNYMLVARKGATPDNGFPQDDIV